MRFYTAAFISALGLTQAGCLPAAPIVIGAAGTGAYLTAQERDVRQGVVDNKISLHIKGKLADKRFAYLTSINIDVLNGDVLLTGIVPTADAGGEVLDIVRRTPDVKNIYNELFVAPAYPASRKAKDTWLATKIKGRLFGDSQIYQVNYMISVVNSHVYVFGLALSDEEHAHVIHTLRTTPGVAQVHDYITLAESARIDVPPEEAEAMRKQGRSFMRSVNEYMPSLPKQGTQAPNMVPDDM